MGVKPPRPQGAARSRPGADTCPCSTMLANAATMRILIKGGKVVNDDCTLEADVYIENGIIQQVGRELMIPGGAKVIDATGKLVIPGGIDTSTHFHQTFMNATCVDDFYHGTKVPPGMVPSALPALPAPRALGGGFAPSSRPLGCRRVPHGASAADGDAGQAGALGGCSRSVWAGCTGSTAAWHCCPHVPIHQVPSLCATALCASTEPPSSLRAPGGAHCELMQ